MYCMYGTKMIPNMKTFTFHNIKTFHLHVYLKVNSLSRSLGVKRLPSRECEQRFLSVEGHLHHWGKGILLLICNRMHNLQEVSDNNIFNYYFHQRYMQISQCNCLPETYFIFLRVNTFIYCLNILHPMDYT